MDEKYDMKVPHFNGTREDDFQLWSLRIKAALRSRELASALIDEAVETKVNEKAMTIIITALGDNPLRAVQECLTAKAVWNKLQGRYAGQSMVNKLSVLNTLLNMILKKSSNMRDHIAILESQFSRLATMGSNLEESLKVAILLSSLSELMEYNAVTVSINALAESTTTWNYVYLIFMEEQKRLTQKIDTSLSVTNTDIARLASSSRMGRNNYIQNEKRTSFRMRCFKCDRLGLKARDCQDTKRVPPTRNGKDAGKWRSRGEKTITGTRKLVPTLPKNWNARK